jgi:fatty-acyl-CoA synthase
VQSHQNIFKTYFQKLSKNESHQTHIFSSAYGFENIYPREIEEFLYAHEAIADVQVIGVPSKKFGEEVMAWVKIKSGYNLTKHELRQFCNSKIARYKVPRYWKFVDSFPLTVTGKIRKVEMREAAIVELGLQEAEKIKTA